MTRKSPFDSLSESAKRQAYLLRQLSQQQRRLDGLMGPAAMKQLESVAASQRHIRQLGLDRAALQSMDSVRRAMEATSHARFAELERLNAAALKLPQPLEMAIQHEKLFSQLRGLDRVATQSVAQYMQALAVEQADYTRFFNSTVSRALGSWQTAIGNEIVDEVGAQLVDQAKAEPERPIQEIVAEAVVAALEKRDKRVDLRFLAQIIIAVLMMLVALLDSQQQQQQLQNIEQTIVQIEAELAKQRSALDLLLTKEVVRRTTIRLRPSGQAKLIGWVEPGTTVIVFQRKGKWTRIGLADTQHSSAGMSGWILNKYLR
jgi:hypothetical protein